MQSLILFKNSQLPYFGIFVFSLAFVISIFLFFSPSLIFAAPAIGSVNGAISSGQVITISGSGFGSAGPVIAIFDDFEKGTDGNKLSTTRGSATVKQWTRHSAYANAYTRYTTAYSHSGTKAARQVWGESGVSEPITYIDVALPANTTSFYTQFWIFIPVGGHVPGENIAGGPNWKVWVVYGGSSELIGNAKSPFESSILKAVKDWPMTGFGFLINNPWPYSTGRQGLISSQGGNYDIGSGGLDIAPGVWHRLEFYNTVGTSSNGTLGAWQMSKNKAWEQIGYGTNYTTALAGHAWDWFRIPAYGRGDNTAITYYDDVYVATGPGARARVEIGNQPTYTNCTNLAIFTPTSWSSTSITATVRTGSFTAGTAYLFVVDSAGNVSTGYPITIDDGK